MVDVAATAMAITTAGPATAGALAAAAIQGGKSACDTLGVWVFPTV